MTRKARLDGSAQKTQAGVPAIPIGGLLMAVQVVVNRGVRRIAQVIDEFSGWAQLAVAVEIVGFSAVLSIGHPMSARTPDVVQIDDSALALPHAPRQRRTHIRSPKIRHFRPMALNKTANVLAAQRTAGKLRFHVLYFFFSSSGSFLSSFFRRGQLWPPWPNCASLAPTTPYPPADSA